MERKGSFFNIVLLFILAFLSLTLAALAGFVFIGGGASSKSTSSIVTQSSVYKPSVSELTALEMIKDPTTFVLKSAAPITGDSTSSQSIIQITFEIKYLIKAPKTSVIKDTALAIEESKGEINAKIVAYFLNLTKTEALKPDAQEKASTELIKQFNTLINDNYNATGDKRADIIYKVIFPYWAPY